MDAGMQCMQVAGMTCFSHQPALHEHRNFCLVEIHFKKSLEADLILASNSTILCRHLRFFLSVCMRGIAGDNKRSCAPAQGLLNKPCMLRRGMPGPS